MVAKTQFIDEHYANEKFISTDRQTRKVSKIRNSINLSPKAFGFHHTRAPNVSVEI